jgi:type IV secretion system protein VirB1
MDMAVIAAALLACMPNIAPATLEAVIAVESRGDPLAIFDNTTRRSWHPLDQAEAIALARRLVAAGHVVDLGLMQVDSGNLPALGLSIAQAFDPCTNIRAGGEILTRDYAYAVGLLGSGQAALKIALSLYNTGDAHRGFRNGYVARYYGRPAVPTVSLNGNFAALDRGRENGHRPADYIGRSSWSAEQLARLSARSSVYSRVSFNFPIR